jgi:hypothetical protein
LPRLTVLQYLRFLNKLELLQTAWGNKSLLALACTTVYNKLNKYYTIIQQKNYTIVVTVCNPRFNFNIFQNFWPNSNYNRQKSCIKKQFAEMFIQYKYREKALKAVTIAVNTEIEHRNKTATSIDIDSESKLFKL